MNKIVISIISFTAGAAVGAFASYKALNKKVNDVLKKETEEITSHYTDRLAAVYQINGETEELPRRNRHAEEKPKKIEFVDYTKFADHQKPPIEDVMQTVDLSKEEYEQEGYIPNPELVPSESGYEDYEQIGLIYYAEDDTLCDDDDAPLKDRTKFIGDIDLLGMLSTASLKEGETKDIFIVNHEMKVLFVVTLVGSSYAEEVLGIEGD